MCNDSFVEKLYGKQVQFEIRVFFIFSDMDAKKKEKKE
jgi:hypothetical protein